MKQQNAATQNAATQNAATQNAAAQNTDAQNTDAQNTNAQNTASDFSKGSIQGNILRMAVPMTLAQLLNVLYNIVDRMYIGRIPGASTLALTGVGICFPLITFSGAFADLYATGGAPLCSIARGRREEERAGKIQGVSFLCWW